jgi:hypothetical protein
MKNASATILAAVLIAGATTLVAEELRHQPVRYARTLLGVAGLGFGLSLVATASPDVADQLAWLIIITSVLVNGQPIFDRLATATGAAPATPAKPPLTHVPPKYL